MTDVPGLPGHEKARHVQRLFGAVAPTYDLLNTLLSAGLHKTWRKRAIDECRLNAGDRALDVATGTGDLAEAQYQKVGEKGLVVGIDFCEPMLRLSVQKYRRDARWVQGDALALPFDRDLFHAVLMGFALRNVADIQQTLNEMTRVAKPGGRIVQLELSRPRNPLFRTVYTLYFHRVLPVIGKLIHGQRENYAYLPESLKAFPEREKIVTMMERAGLEDVTVNDLTFGIVTVFSGTKRQEKPGSTTNGATAHFTLTLPASRPMIVTEGETVNNSQGEFA